MMNIPPSEAKALSLWEYDALMAGWNAAHSEGDDAPIVDHATTQRLIDDLRSRPELLQGKTKEGRERDRKPVLA